MNLNPDRSPVWSRHLIVALAFVVAVTVRGLLLGTLGTRVPFLTLYPAVILAAFYAGLQGGLLVTVLSAVTAGYAWMEPVGQFSIRDTADWLAIGIFVLSGAAISWIVRQMRRSQARAGEAEVELKLARERERAHIALDASNSGTWEWDLRTGENYWSEELWKIYGLEPHSLVPSYEAWRQLVLEEDRPAAEQALRDAAEKGLELNVEFRVRGRDGKNRWLMARAQALRDASGQTTRYVGIALDITERKRAEEALRRSEAALRESESRYRQLVDLAPESITVHQDGRIVYCNEAAGRLYGADSPASLLGTDVFDRVHPEDLPAVRDRIRAAERGSRLPLRETRHLRLDGSEVAVETTAGPVEWRGRPALLLFARDITDRLRAEARLRDAQKLESLGLLAGGVAHDFNNLLVGVIGNASLAQDMLPPGHPAGELLESVLRIGEQAAHLTRQMLAYSGKGRFVVEPLNLSTLLPELSILVRPSISKKIAVILDLDPYLPAIEADRGQIQQVFMNLALNAAEAIGSQEGMITVRTLVRNVGKHDSQLHGDTLALAPGKYVCLEVRDTGCGMDESTRARIFDPFFSTKFTGRGLGLAAVAGIVRGHKGGIAVSSAPGQGSCFSVVFPATARSAEAPAATAGDAPLHGAGTILLVDDEEMVREMAKKALERHGYTVLVADGGAAAIDIFRRHPGPIALVILDLSMPQMSGEEALAELRKIRPEVKVVVSSGYSESEAMPLFEGQRVCGFIQKPYTTKGIAERVKAALE